MSGKQVTNRAVFCTLASLLLIAVPLWEFLPLSILGGYAVLLVLRAVWQIQGWKLPSSLIKLLLLFAAIGGLWVSTKTLIGREGGVAFLLLLVAFKSFETPGLRDWRILVSLGFFLCAMPLLFDQSPVAAVWLVITLFLLIWSLAALTGEPLWDSVCQAAVALVLSLPLMAVLFVIVPRLPGPVFGLPSPQASMTGLGDEMEPGKFSELIQNNTPAFNVVFDPTQPPPANRDMYWRVAIFDDYNGVSWGRSDFPYRDRSQLANLPSRRYTITAALDRGRMPAMDYPRAAGGGLQLLDGRVLRGRPSDQETRRLAMESVATNTLGEALDAAAQLHYRQIPAGNRRTRELVQQLRSQTAGGTERQFIDQVLAYFHNEPFRYTLSPPLLQWQDRVDQFMFSTRQGFCEHYASAFAFMMRAAGLPTRVVIGYQGGEYNQDGRFWQVRSKDAHAWTEVWLPSEQVWLRVDPTAAVSPDRVEAGIEQAVPETRPTGLLGGVESEWTRTMRRKWQAANFEWQQWVVGYDNTRQQRMFSKLGLGERVTIKNVIIGLLVGVTLALLPLWFWYRRTRPRLPPLSAGWKLLQHRLQRAGMTFKLSDGPQELEQKVKDQLLRTQDVQSLQELIKDYMQLRYAVVETDDKAARRWVAKVKGFRPAKHKRNKISRRK